MKIAIVTDSTANVPDALKEKHNIFTIPLSVVFGDESLREEIDITTPEFYERLEGIDELPTTSQPAIGHFVELFESLAKDYDEVISIHISGNFSGTVDAAASASTMVDSVKVYPFDTHFSSMPQGLFALTAAEMVEDGKTSAQILEKLADMKRTVRAYFIVDELTNLHKGGRLTGAQALIGSLLNVKPVLHIVDGVIVPFEKIRTRKKAINRILSMVEEAAAKGDVRKVVFMHGNNEPSALELEAKFAEKYPEIETIISCFGPVLATHLGANSLGVSWYTE